MSSRSTPIEAKAAVGSASPDMPPETESTSASGSALRRAALILVAVPRGSGSDSAVHAGGDLDDDNEELHLPALDEEEDEAENGPIDIGDLLTPLADDSVDPFDDSTAADLETGVDLGLDEGGPRCEDEPADGGIDVGPLDDGLTIRDEENSLLDDRHENGPGEEDDFECQELRGADDGGAEGPSDSGDDDVSEADLPALDADEHGDFDSEDLLAEMTFAPDTTLPPWDALRWATVQGCGAAVPCSSLAIAAGRVAAGGEVVLLVDEGADAARRTAFEAGVSSIAITDEGAMVGAGRSHLWISRDEGRSTSVLGGWRGGRSAAELAATPGRLWILSQGALWSMATLDGVATEVRSGGVKRMIASGAALVALTRAVSGPSIERLRGDDEGWHTTQLTGDVRRVALSDGVELAAAGGGRLIALGAEEALCVSRDGGASFDVVPLPGAVALAFAGDSADAPLLALLARRTEDAACLVTVPTQGPPARIADIAGGSGVEGSPEDDSAFGAAAMGWDASREVAWIACRSGLLALARATKH